MQQGQQAMSEPAVATDTEDDFNQADHTHQESFYCWSLVNNQWRPVFRCNTCGHQREI